MNQAPSFRERRSTVTELLTSQSTCILAVRPLRVCSKNTQEMRPDRRSNQGGRNWESDPM